MNHSARPVPGTRHRHRGFTLIELLIAIVVAAILVSIAIPSYSGYVQRARRAEATSALLRAQAAQERFFVQFGQYATALAPAPPAGLGLPTVTEAGLYGLTLAITEGGAGFRITATAQAGTPQAADSRCASFTIDHNGLRGARDAVDADSARDCWR